MNRQHFCLSLRLLENPELKLFQERGLFLVIHPKPNLIFDQADIEIRNVSELVLVNELLQGLSLFPIPDFINFVRDINKPKGGKVILFPFESVVYFVFIDFETIDGCCGFTKAA